MSPAARTAKLRHAQAVLRETALDGGDAGSEPLAAIADLLRLDRACSYSLRMLDGRARIDVAHTFQADGFLERFDAFLAHAPRQFGAYDPVRPQPWQRNRPLRPIDVDDYAQAVLYRELYPKLGIAQKHQLRMLVCDGPALLGWVGGWREGEFREQEVEALRALLPALKRQLRLVAHFGHARLLLETLGVALEAFGAPAFVVRVDGYPAYANAAGTACLSEAPETRERLARAVRLGDSDARVTPISARGAPPHWLVVLPPARPDLLVMLERAAAVWSLTPRQTEVLSHVVQGTPNKTIAATLGCSVRAVEVHVTALLDKTQTGSRAELRAKFWREG
jgi:DNA-binding CsgD family transcriptional regulator